MSSARRMMMLGRDGPASCEVAAAPAVSRRATRRVFMAEDSTAAGRSGFRKFVRGLFERLERRLVLRPPGAPGLRGAVRLAGDLVERLVDRGDQFRRALAGAVVAA